MLLDNMRCSLLRYHHAIIVDFCTETDAKTGAAWNKHSINELPEDFVYFKWQTINKVMLYEIAYLSLITCRIILYISVGVTDSISILLVDIYNMVRFTCIDISIVWESAEVILLLCVWLCVLYAVFVWQGTSKAQVISLYT